MSLTRGGVQPRLQNQVSYSNPFTSAPSLYTGTAPGETLLALTAGAALAGLGYPPRSYPNGLFPMTTALLVGAAV